MDIKTRFNLGQKVWTILRAKAVELEIYRITVDAIRDNVAFEKYYLRYPYKAGDIFTCSVNNRTFTDREIFATKEELINQL